MSGTSASGDADKKGGVRRYVVWGMLILAVFGLIEILSELVSPQIGVWSFFVLAAGLMVYPIVDFFRHQIYDSEMEYQRQLPVRFGPEENPYKPLPFLLTLAFLFGFIVSSGEFLRFWSQAYGGFRGYSPTSHDAFGWLRDRKGL